MGHCCEPSLLTTAEQATMWDRVEQSCNRRYWLRLGKLHHAVERSFYAVWVLQVAPESLQPASKQSPSKGCPYLVAPVTPSLVKATEFAIPRIMRFSSLPLCAMPGPQTESTSVFPSASLLG